MEPGLLGILAFGIVAMTFDDGSVTQRRKIQNLE